MTTEILFHLFVYFQFGYAVNMLFKSIAILNKRYAKQDPSAGGKSIMADSKQVGKYVEIFRQVHYKTYLGL